MRKLPTIQCRLLAVAADYASRQTSYTHLAVQASRLTGMDELRAAIGHALLYGDVWGRHELTDWLRGPHDRDQWATAAEWQSAAFAAIERDIRLTGREGRRWTLFPDQIKPAWAYFEFREG